MNTFVTLGLMVVLTVSAYVDRYCLAGVLEEVAKEHEMTYYQRGFLFTSFIFCYILGSLTFGVLGRRTNRMRLLSGGCAIWSMANLLGIFVPRGNFWLFCITRGMVGAGEASITTIGPPLIADLFEVRGIKLTIFYLAKPIGGGFGYIIGSQAYAYFGVWKIALAITPFVCIPVGIIFWFVPDPINKVMTKTSRSRGTLRQSLFVILTNKSLWLNNVGCACMSFGMGAISWWVPTYFSKAFSLRAGLVSPLEESRISSTYGTMSIFTGFFGIALGYGLGILLGKCTKKAQVIGCALALLVSPPFLLSSLYLATSNELGAWMTFMIGQVIFSMNPIYVANILLDTIPRIHRTAAVGFQTFFAHLLGDVLSPSLVGLVTQMQKGSTATQEEEVYALRNALIIPPFAYALGSLCYLLLLCFYSADVRRCLSDVEQGEDESAIPMSTSFNETEAESSKK